MSEEEVAFDDWEAQAEAVVEQVKNELPQQAETKQQKVEEKEEGSKQAQEIVDPRTAFLKNLNFYKSLQGQKFDEYFEEAKSNSNTSVLKATNQILKNDKDFTQLAKAVGKRFNEQLAEEQAQNLDEDSLFGYWQELIYLIYEQSEWINLDNTKDKLKIVKKARKQDEVKAKKQKEKEQRQRKQQKLTQQQNSKKQAAKQAKQEVQQQDIFGGATFVNSKQKEDELKNKKVQAPKPSVQEDDDDFM